MAGCALAPPQTPGTLIQIRRGYAADCNGLRLSVELDSGGWNARVAGGGQTLYAARRCSLRAAKIVATEFAMWSGGKMAQGTLEILAEGLSWREYW